jgi:hypothetical protein
VDNQQLGRIVSIVTYAAYLEPVPRIQCNICSNPTTADIQTRQTESVLNLSVRSAD